MVIAVTLTNYTLQHERKLCVNETEKNKQLLAEVLESSNIALARIKHDVVFGRSSPGGSTSYFCGCVFYQVVQKHYLGEAGK